MKSRLHGRCLSLSGVNFFKLTSAERQVDYFNHKKFQLFGYVFTKKATSVFGNSTYVNGLKLYSVTVLRALACLRRRIVHLFRVRLWQSSIGGLFAVGALNKPRAVTCECPLVVHWKQGGSRQRICFLSVIVSFNVHYSVASCLFLQKN